MGSVFNFAFDNSAVQLVILDTIFEYIRTIDGGIVNIKKGNQAFFKMTDCIFTETITDTKGIV